NPRGTLWRRTGAGQMVPTLADFRVSAIPVYDVARRHPWWPWIACPAQAGHCFAEPARLWAWLRPQETKCRRALRDARMASHGEAGVGGGRPLFPKNEIPPFIIKKRFFEVVVGRPLLPPVFCARPPLFVECAVCGRDNHPPDP